MQGNLTELQIPPDAFQAIVTGDDVRKKKPDPQIFELAASRLGLAPASCVVIEDAPNGIRAAKSAGARCLGVLSSFAVATLRENGADWTAQYLAHLPADFLAELNEP